LTELPKAILLTVAHPKPAPQTGDSFRILPAAGSRIRDIPFGDLRMKKVCASLLLVLIAIGWNVPASALPPFNVEWKAKYNTGEKNAKFVEAKCNVCHEGTNKKMKNEYGKAVGKYLTKAKYMEIKEDEAAAKKYIIEGLQKAEAEKNAAGKPYGELLKAGNLPGGA
jgi:hypothetical protein